MTNNSVIIQTNPVQSISAGASQLFASNRNPGMNGLLVTNNPAALYFGYNNTVTATNNVLFRVDPNANGVFVPYPPGTEIWVWSAGAQANLSIHQASSDSWAGILQKGSDAYVDQVETYLATLADTVSGASIVRTGEVWASEYYSTAASATIKTGGGIFGGIVIGETAAGAITVYDNTAASGKILAVLKASIAENEYMYRMPFTTGLTVDRAAASKITVLYR